MLMQIYRAVRELAVPEPGRCKKRRRLGLRLFVKFVGNKSLRAAREELRTFL